MTFSPQQFADKFHLAAEQAAKRTSRRFEGLNNVFPRILRDGILHHKLFDEG